MARAHATAWAYLRRELLMSKRSGRRRWWRSQRRRHRAWVKVETAEEALSKTNAGVGTVLLQHVSRTTVADCTLVIVRHKKVWEEGQFVGFLRTRAREMFHLWVDGGEKLFTRMTSFSFFKIISFLLSAALLNFDEIPREARRYEI